MKKEIYGAAAKGDVEFLIEALAKDVESMTAVYNDTDFLELTSYGNNIIHVAAQHGHLDFVVEALQSFQEADVRRKLIYGTNSDGDTLFTLQPSNIMEEAYGARAPWRIQNKDGNTPLHIALLNGGRSFRVAAYLLEIDPQVAALPLTNNRKEAPLHLAVTYDHQRTEKSSIKMINSLNGQGAALSTRNSVFVQENEDISIALVWSLLKENREVCCLCDADGMTPLLRAAVRSNLPVVDAIVDECAESIEVCDPKGKNMLHYIRFSTSLEARKFMEKPELPVSLLINQQDHDGNTPTHIAVMNHDFKMLKAMAEHNANFAIENKEGVSAQTLFDQFVINNKLMMDVSAETKIESKSNKLRDSVEKGNEKEVMKDELMSYDIYKAVGKWETVRGMLNDEKQFVCRLPDGSNIIHLAIQGLVSNNHCKDDYSIIKAEELIVDALKKYPVLFSQTNHLGQTPLHLKMIGDWNFRPGTQLYSNIKEELMNLKGRGELPALPPWKVKDVQGNTILHCAIKHHNYELAKCLIELDANLAAEVNHSKQTPLHLLCQEPMDFIITTEDTLYVWSEDVKRLVKLLVEKDVSSALYMRDVEGFTPLLRAAQVMFVNEGIAIEIVKQHPQSIQQTDPHARNFFHYLCMKKSLSQISR
ncbi:Protein ACCELERATED CELL DEATH 6 [Bienertia sinuspersici]